MTPPDLVVVGAGGSSREIAEAVGRLNAATPRWRLLGFLDDDPALRGRTVGGLPILGSALDARGQPGWSLVIGIAHPRYPGIRPRVAGKLGLPPERFATVVDPSASVSASARIGPGSAVLAQAYVAHDAVIGEHVIVSSLCSVSHGVRLDEGVTLAAGAIVSGGSHVGAGAYLGAGSVVLDGLRVGAEALVGLGAVVVRDVPAGAAVVGNPARPLPDRGGGGEADAGKVGGAASGPP